jgi:glyoxylase-like metal-dependent hydrolase (beta-lactamase superfamily II)
MEAVSILNIKFDIENVTNTIHPVILNHEQELILIDCGYPNFLPLIEMKAKEKGISIERLTKIIITHHDFDHMGALAEFKSKYPKIEILSSVDEERYISGKEKSLRLQQAEALYSSLPEDEKENADKFHQLLSSIKNVNVDLLLEDHQEFSWCRGAEIISTPGHTPGHISIYLKKGKTLIAGDALVVENGELGIANPQYTLDMREAKNSIKKLLNYDIERIICYHGGVFTENIREALQKIL